MPIIQSTCRSEPEVVCISRIVWVFYCMSEDIILFDIETLILTHRGTVFAIFSLCYFLCCVSKCTLRTMFILNVLLDRVKSAYFVHMCISFYVSFLSNCLQGCCSFITLVICYCFLLDVHFSGQHKLCMKWNSGHLWIILSSATFQVQYHLVLWQMLLHLSACMVRWNIFLSFSPVMVCLWISSVLYMYVSLLCLYWVAATVSVVAVNLAASLLCTLFSCVVVFRQL